MVLKNYTMELSKLLNLNTGANVQIIATPEQLSKLAFDVASETAKRIIAEVNLPDKPLSEKEVCEQVGKTRQTLSKYRREGKLRFHRIGREIFYFPSELKEDLLNL